MKRILLAATLTLVTAFAMACADKKEDAEAPTAAPEPTAPTPAATAPDEAKDGADEEAAPVPTAMDYEEEAAQEITPDNLEEQVKSMEEELGE